MNWTTATMALVLTLSSQGAQIARAADTETIKEAVRAKVYEITGKDSAVVPFEKGSAKVAESDKEALKGMIKAVKGTGAIKETLVLAYSDLDYPRDQKGDLPDKSRKLAMARGSAVKELLREYGATNVSVHNMAKKASWLERTFVTSDAQLKGEAESKKSPASADNAFYESLGDHLKTYGGAGKVVVVVRHEQTPLTN